MSGRNRKLQDLNLTDSDSPDVAIGLEQVSDFLFGDVERRIAYEYGWAGWIVLCLIFYTRSVI